MGAWMDPAEVTEEAVRTGLFAAGTLYLAWRGRTHDLRDRPGWRLVLGGLALLTLGSLADLFDEFGVVRHLPAVLVAEPWDLLETFTELLAPVVGTLLLMAGFLLWLPLPARLSKAEADLRKANEELQGRVATSKSAWETLISNVPDYILLIDQEGRVVYANRTPAGLRMEDVLGRPIADFVPDPGQRADMLAAVQQALAGGPASKVEVVGPGPDGRPATYSLRIMPSAQADGRPAALMLNIDVTEELRVRDTLRASDERFRMAAAATMDVIWDLDVAADRLVWGDALTTVLGHDRAALEPGLASWTALVHPDDLERIEASFRAALAGDASQWQGEYRFRRGDGSWAQLLDRCTIVRDADGRARRAVGAMTDLSMLIQLRRQAEEKTLEAQRLQQEAAFKTQFLNMAAHELATPLTPLKLQVATMRAMPAGQADPEGFDLLQRNVNRLAALVNDLLDAARLQASGLPLDLRPIDAPRLLARVAASFAGQARDAGVALAVRPSPAAVPFTGDEARLEQVLFNLVHNALKFTPRGGEVWLGARQDGPSIVLEVDDTGVGLGPEQLARLFQPFSQVHDPAKVKAGGTGLGLYIARGIAQQHGGELRARSAGPGQGASFGLWLPVSPAQPGASSAPASGAGPRRVDGGPAPR